DCAPLAFPPPALLSRPRLASSVRPPLRYRVVLSFKLRRANPDLHSFPTRRSSDLRQRQHVRLRPLWTLPVGDSASRPRRRPSSQDRKSTRLNSSHVAISYAVFCLEKKTGLGT